MKICIVLEFFIPHYNGGGEHRFYEITKRLVQRGHEVDLLTMKIAGDKELEYIDGIRVHHIGPKIKKIPYRTKTDFIKYFFSVCKWILTHDYDIIDAQAYSPLLSSYVASKFKRTPIIGTIYDTSTNNNDQWLQSPTIANRMEKILLNLHFNKIITISQPTMNSLINDFGVNDKKMELLYCGVDIQKYDNVTTNTLHKNQIIFVGRLAPHKHVDHYIQVINEIKPLFPNLNFIIVGKGTEKENLVSMINDLNLNDCITFKQDLSDEELITEIKQSEILVLPSTREGFGMVLAEANCCNKPVITYASGGTVDVVKDGYNGYLIEAGNIKELKEKTINLLENEKLREEIGNNGRKRVEELFDWENITDDYIKILENTINKK